MAGRPKRRANAACGCRKRNPFTLHRGRYVMPAEDDLPATLYTSHVYHVGAGRRDVEVVKQDPGYPPVELYDGPVAGLREALRYDSRVRTRRIAPMVKALTGEGAGRAQGARKRNPAMGRRSPGKWWIVAPQGVGSEHCRLVRLPGRHAEFQRVSIPGTVTMIANPRPRRAARRGHR